MDPTPSPLARVGQVFWAALNYVTAAVQRYLTPELANTGNDDTSTGQEATISVATETQEWTDDGKHERENNERAEKKMREDGESVADACDSGCGHAKTWEQCTVSIATETDRKTDQYVVKDIKVRVTEKVIEREDVGKEPTTQIENEAKSPHFNDEERDIKRHGSILKSGGEQKTKRVEEKTKDKESGKLFCDGDGGKQNETKDRDRGREGEHEDLTKTDEVRTIRGAEEENEVLRELIEEAVVMLVEDDEMDIETKGLRNKEGTEEKIQPEGNGADGGKEFKVVLVSRAIGVGDECIETVERGRQGSVKKAHVIKEETKKEMEMVTRLTVSVKEGELEKKDVGSDRDFLKSGGGKDKERYEEKDSTQQLLIEEQYGEVSGREEEKKDDEEELALDREGMQMTHVERGEEKTHACDMIKGGDERDNVKAEGETHKAISEGDTEEKMCVRDVEEGDKEGTDEEIGGTDRVKYENIYGGTSNSSENIGGDEEFVKEQDGELTKRLTEAEKGFRKGTNEIDTQKGSEDKITSRMDVERMVKKEQEHHRQLDSEGEEEREKERVEWTDDIEPYGGEKMKVRGARLLETIKEDNVEKRIGVETEWWEDINYGAEREMDRGNQTEKETGSQKEGQIGKAFNSRGEVSGTESQNEMSGEAESGEILGGEKTIAEFEGVEKEGSLQRTHGDIEDISEYKVSQLETNWDEEGTVLIEGEETGNRGNKAKVQEERGGQTAVTVGDEESKNFESEREIETGEKIENNVGEWRDVPTKEQAIQESERGQNGNSALGRQIGAYNMDGDKAISDFENIELSQTEATVGNKENECKGYTEEDEMEDIEIRKIEAEKREFKEIAEECGVVAGGKESKNVMAERAEEETKTMIEEKQEHETHVIKETKEEPIVAQEGMGSHLNPTVEIEAGAVDEDGDDEDEKEGEEEGMIEVGESEYSGEMETNMLGTEDHGDEIEVRSELRVPISVGRNDKGVLSEETNSDVERDHFSKETETDKDADEKDIGILNTDEDEKDIGILNTDEDERITDIDRNENNFREMRVENKENGQNGNSALGRQIGAYNMDGDKAISDFENIELSQTEATVGNKENECKGYTEEDEMEDIEIRKIEAEKREFKEIAEECGVVAGGKESKNVMVERAEEETKTMIEEKQEHETHVIKETKEEPIVAQEGMGSHLNPTVEIEAGAVDEDGDDEDEKEGEEEGMIEVGESEYSGEMETNMLGTEDHGDEIEVRSELRVAISVGRNDKGVLSEETNSDVERDHFSKETETDKDADEKDIGILNTDEDEKDIGILNTDEDERITDIDRNENNFREMRVENKENGQNGNSALGRQIGAYNMDGDKAISDFEKIELSQTEATVGNKENECKGYTEEDEMEDIEIRKIEAEKREFKEIAEECGVVAGGKESKNVMVERAEEETKTMIEEKQEHETHVIKETKEEPIVAQEGMGSHLIPTVEIEAGAVDEDGDDEDEKEGEEEGMIEVGESEYSGEMETNMLGTEDHGDEIEVRSELRVPISVGRNDKGVLSEETNSDVERDHFSKETETDKDADEKDIEILNTDEDEKDIGILNTDEDERITDIDRNENNFREMRVENKENGQNGNSALGRQIGAYNMDGDKAISDFENIELSQTEATVGNKENECKGYTEEDEMEDIEIRKIEAEKREFKEIAEECGVVAGGKESKNVMAERAEEETKTMIEEKQEHETHVIKETKEEPIVAQEGMGSHLNPTVEIEAGAVDEDGDDEDEKEGEEEGMIEVGESEYSGEMETNMLGTEDHGDEIEVRSELRVPISVGRNDKGVLSEETNSDMERDHFSKETETDKDADEKDIGILNTDEDEKDIGILNTDEDERITDIDRNENNFREMRVENKENEQREHEECSEDNNMESGKVSKTETEVIYINKSEGEIERVTSMAEIEKVETIWQDVEIRGEIEEDKGIKAHVEEVCHKGALEKLVLEAEEDKLLREGWKENIEIDKRGGSSNGVQVNIILDGDRKERKDDERMNLEEQGQFSELTTEGKQGNRENNLDPTVEIEAGAMDEEEDDDGIILKEGTEGKKTKDIGESEYSGDMEANVWGTEEKGDEIEGRTEEVRKVVIDNRHIHDDFGIEVAGHTEKAELKGEEEEMKETDRNSEEVKITEIHWEKFDAKEKDEKTTTRLDNKENEENEEIKETIDKGVELHGPLDFTAQKCRIALKNPHSRPPRNPRTLLHTPSLLPTPSKSPHSGQLNIVSMAVKQGGPRITGFRLPGMDGGFPALKRTHRGAREREEGVTAENSKAPDATETLNSEREELVGDNVVGPGVIGFKLPSFPVEFPGLRKTERGVNMREQTPEKDTTPHNNSTERSDRTGTDSIKGITVQAVKLTTGFGSGFPVLRKTDRGVRIREDDTQNSDVEVKTTVVDHQESLPKSKSKWTPPGKPGIGIGNPSMMSELKNKLRKTE